MPLVDSIIHDIKNNVQIVYNDKVLSNQYAWWILQAITKKNKAQLIESQIIVLNEEQKKMLENWIAKLTKEQCPLQYLLGSVPFNGVDICVEAPVLIPRPETEEWTVNLIEKLVQLAEARLSILDLCTGSGCIAIALAKALPKAHIVATDIQEHAIKLAKKNCQHNRVNNVMVLKSDLFTSIPQGSKFDLILGNPPYIADDEWIELEPSVKNWEDKTALVAHEHGLEIISKIIKQAPQFLKPNTELETAGVAQLILEIGYRQGGLVHTLLEQSGYCQIKIEKDLEGKDRVALARVVPCGYINAL